MVWPPLRDQRNQAGTPEQNSAKINRTVIDVDPGTKNVAAMNDLVIRICCYRLISLPSDRADLDLWPGGIHSTIICFGACQRDSFFCDISPFASFLSRNL